MKKLFATLAFLSALTCIGAPAGHAAVTTRTTFTSDFTFFDVCTGESVHIVGELDILATSTITDNTIAGTFHTVFKATGTGLNSGTEYQEIVVFNRAFTSSLQNGEATVTQVAAIRVIAPGQGNNLVSPFFIHMTINANGDVTSAKVESPGPSCG